MSTAPDDEAPLVPIEERAVQFYEDEIFAVAVEIEGDRQIFVPIRPIAQYLGLDWASQYQRIKRDPILNEAVRSIVVTTTEAGKRSTLCLPIEMLHGWLFGVNAARVREDLREKVLRYRRECFRVLWHAFQAESLPATEEHLSASDVPTTTLAQIQGLAFAIAEMAGQQMAFEQRVDDRFDRATAAFTALQRRLSQAEKAVSALDNQAADFDDAINEIRQLLTRLESQVRALPAPRASQIDPEQKAAIKALVDDIVAAAQERGVRLGQGRNDYPAVWDAFKRRFDLAKYDDLTLAQYDEALNWLKAWRDRVRAG